MFVSHLQFAMGEKFCKLSTTQSWCAMCINYIREDLYDNIAMSGGSIMYYIPR